MPTFIILAKWTQKGIESVKDSPKRLDAFKQIVESMGGTLKAFYMVEGRYDMVLVMEAPNDEAVAKVALATGSKGSVTSETLHAFTEAEYRKIIDALP